MIRQLSPVAQAVFNAFLGDAEDTELEPDDMRENIAAALRAIADVNVGTDYQNGKRVATILRSDILAIATELESQ
jgi:hypothetical protein